MPKIPTIEATGSVQTPLGNSELVLRGDEYGTELRRSAAVLSAEIDKRIHDEEELHVTKTLADARSQFYERLRKKAEDAKPGAPNFTAEFMGEFDAYKEQALAEGTQYTRKQIEAGLANVRTSLFQSATDFEAKARVEKRKDDVREIVNKLGNSLINAPGTFKDVLADADRAADAAGLPPRETTALKKQIREGLSAVTVSEIIRQSPGAAINRLKAGEWDAYLDPAKKSSLLDHATSEARRRATEAKMVQAAERGNQALDLKDHIALRQSGDTGTPLPPTLSDTALKNAGWRDDQIRRIKEQITLADSIAPFAAKIKETPYDAFGALAEEAKKFAMRTDTGLGPHSTAQFAVEISKQLKLGEKERAALGSNLIRQAFYNAFQFKETLVEGDPQGQHVYISQKPTYEEWKASVAPVLGENAAKQTYSLIEKAGELSPERLPAMFENLEKAVKPGEAMYAAEKFVREELLKRDTALREHPGEWVTKNRPEVKAAWADYARVAGETDPKSFARTVALRNAVDLTLQAQRDLGVANPVLPKTFVGDFIDRLKTASTRDPQAAAQMLRQMEQNIGAKNMPEFFRSLAHDGNTPPELRVALMQNNPTSTMSAEIMSALSMDLAKAKAQVPNDKHSDVDRAVESATSNLRASIPFDGGGLRDRNDILQVTEKLTYKYMAERGMGANEAAKQAARWIGEQFNFHHTNGAVVRVPKDVRVYTSAMAHYIAKFDGDIAPVPGLTRDEVLASVRAFGSFKNAPDGHGVFLTNRSGQVLNDSAGRQIFIPWSAFEQLPKIESSPDADRWAPIIQRDYDKKFRDAYDPRNYAPERYR